MANYENTQDLKKGVLFRCGELDDGTSEYDSKVIEYLNRAYQALLSGGAELGLDVGEPWPWAQNIYPTILNMEPDVTTLSCSFTNNSTAGVLSSAPAVSYQDWMIQVVGEAEVYRIAAHTAGSANITLDGGYVGETGAAKPVTIFKTDYDLDDGILRLSHPFTTYYTSLGIYGSMPGLVQGVDESQFVREFPIYATQTGVPTHFTQIFKSDTMKPRVRFNATPDQIVRIEYNYIPVPQPLFDSVTSIPIVPRDHRITLEYYASYYLCLDKNDNRTQEFRNLTIAGINAMTKAYKKEKINTNFDFGRLIARPDMVYDYRRITDWWW